MARYRTVRTRVWVSMDELGLGPLERLCWLALLTHPRLVPIGALHLPEVAELGRMIVGSPLGTGYPIEGSPEELAERCLTRLKNEGLIFWAYPVLIIRKYLLRNPYRDTHAAGWLVQLIDFPKSPAWGQFREYLRGIEEPDSVPEWMFEAVLDPLAEGRVEELDKRRFWGIVKTKPRQRKDGSFAARPGRRTQRDGVRDTQGDSQRRGVPSTDEPYPIERKGGESEGTVQGTGYPTPYNRSGSGSGFLPPLPPRAESSPDGVGIPSQEAGAGPTAGAAAPATPPKGLAPPGPPGGVDSRGGPGAESSPDPDPDPGEPRALRAWRTEREWVEHAIEQGLGPAELERVLAEDPPVSPVHPQRAGHSVAEDRAVAGRQLRALWQAGLAEVLADYPNPGPTARAERAWAKLMPTRARGAGGNGRVPDPARFEAQFAAVQQALANRSRDWQERPADKWPQLARFLAEEVEV